MRPEQQRDRWAVGVTVGKFNPPHLGHLHLVRTAAARCDHLYVLLGDRPDQTLDASERASWLADAAPDNATIVITPDDLPEANEPWAERALQVLPVPPGVAFTSEPWGPGWAAAMGADHVSVDEPRSTHPISARTIRDDLRGTFRWLVPAARAGLALRVVLAGAESTGKTTLAVQLAEHLRTVWVPEHGRTYWEGRRFVEPAHWDADELRRIARSQGLVEDDLARQADAGVVVVDTDALVTAVWSERYLGSLDPWLLAEAERRRPHLYLVCSPDIPWVQDGTRESEAQRSEMHARTLELVAASGVDHIVLQGPPRHRLSTALAAIERCTALPPLI